jgi:hypothetical protein
MCACVCMCVAQDARAVVPSALESVAANAESALDRTARVLRDELRAASANALSRADVTTLIEDALKVLSLSRFLSLSLSLSLYIYIYIYI